MIDSSLDKQNFKQNRKNERLNLDGITKHGWQSNVSLFPRKFGGLATIFGGEFRRSRLWRSNINRMRFYILFILYSKQWIQLNKYFQLNSNITLSVLNVGSMSPYSLMKGIVPVIINLIHIHHQQAYIYIPSSSSLYCT